MKKIKSAVLFLNAFVALSVYSNRASADQTTGAVNPPGACQDLVIVMKDDTNDVSNPKKMTVFLDCHEANGNIPSGTTMNFFIFDQGRLCHGYRVCGNLSGWEGAFKVGTTWYYGRHFGDAYDVADNCGQDDTSCRSNDYPFAGYGLSHPGYPGYGYGYPYGSTGRSNVHVDFVTKFSNIERHCGQLHDYQCLELPSLPVRPGK